MRERVRADVVNLVHRGRGLPGFAQGAMQVLERAVPSHGLCLLTIDPSTPLPTAEVVVNGLPPEDRRRLTEIELQEPDYNKIAVLARQRRRAARLSEATGGDLNRSLRQREVRGPSGFGDELRVVLADGTGVWGALPVDEVDGTGHPPLVVRAVAARARWLAGGEGPDVVPGATARARVRTRSGRVAILRAPLMGDDQSPRVAVLVEAARAAELAPLIAESYGLTAPERAITELVGQGLSTREIADRLFLATYTVQDHLKSIFDKSATRSRGELVARLFFGHDSPRLTDPA